MASLLILLLLITILNHVTNRWLIKKWDIKQKDLESQPFNRFHKYGEKLLYWISYFATFIIIVNYPHLRIFIFLNMAVIFVCRATLEWYFMRENKVYRLSGVTSGLLIIGFCIYAILINDIT